MYLPLYVRWCFSLSGFTIISLFFSVETFMMVWHWESSFLLTSILTSKCFLCMVSISSPRFEEFSVINSVNKLFVSFVLFNSFFYTMVSQSSWKLWSSLLIFLSILTSAMFPQTYLQAPIFFLLLKLVYYWCFLLCIYIWILKIFISNFSISFFLFQNLNFLNFLSLLLILCPGL